jgi:hypothetical protein
MTSPSPRISGFRQRIPMTRNDLTRLLLARALQQQGRHSVFHGASVCCWRAGLSRCRRRFGRRRGSAMVERVAASSRDCEQQICCNDGEVLIEVRLIGCVCRPFHGSEWMAKRGCNDDPRHQCAGDPAGLDADQDRLNRRTAQSPQSDSLARSAPRRRSDQVHEAFGAWVIDDA